MIETDVVEQYKLEADYTALLASAKFEFQGESLTLSEMPSLMNIRCATCGTRRRGSAGRWFGENREKLDETFDELVRLRQ